MITNYKLSNKTKHKSDNKSQYLICASRIPPGHTWRHRGRRVGAGCSDQAPCAGDGLLSPGGPGDDGLSDPGDGLLGHKPYIKKISKRTFEVQIRFVRRNS